jgi:hypothetical protein
LSAALTDVDQAESILVIGTDPMHSMPILDLRLRKAVRHGGARLVVASERPTALDGGAEETLRYAPGGAGELLRALVGQLNGGSDGGRTGSGVASSGTEGSGEGRGSDAESTAGYPAGTG